MSDGRFMALRARLGRFAQKTAAERWAAINATLRSLLGGDALERRRLQRLLAGAHALPTVLESDEKVYVAYRPDSDVNFSCYPELAALSVKWVKNNGKNNAGDLPRLYALIMNIRQVFDERVEGDIAELGVYRGNSAAILSHYARVHSRELFLFDTFEGFDRRDLIGDDGVKGIQFKDTSLGYVRDFVGEENVTFFPGRFPQSVPAHLHERRFCLVHIDCDLYEPAKAGFEFFFPRLSPGGLLVIHDYANPYWPGIKRAADDYCAGISERLLVFGDKSGTAMIRKSWPSCSTNMELIST
jgi:hypothetical protein